MACEFYVYRIFDGMETVYVGKGSGRRLQSQIRNFSLPGEVVEICKSDDDAFAREIHWISVLRPTANKAGGGNGGRVLPKIKPAWLVKAEKEYQKFVAEYERVGPRRYVAQFLSRKIDEQNCEALGASKVELIRLREVANGQWR